MSLNDDINFLADKVGLWREYTDSISGKIVPAKKPVQKEMLKILGLPAENEKQASKSIQKCLEHEWSRVVPPVAVVKEGVGVEIPLILPMTNRPKVVTWVLVQENLISRTDTVSSEQLRQAEQQTIGEITYQKFFIRLPSDVPQGYHKLTFLINGETVQTGGDMRLIVTPHACYKAPAIQNGGKVWGVPLQLYALQSKNNWGIGDFTDLGAFSKIAENLNMGLVGINPVSALFLDRPENASPYFASSRFYLNPLYVDVTKVPEYTKAKELKEWMATDEFKNLMHKAKKCKTIDYTAVAALKEKAFHYLYDVFMVTHLGEEPTKRGKEFLIYCEDEGNTLTDFALFHALRVYFHEKGESLLWWRWPKAYRSPKETGSILFAQKNPDKVRFFKYLQFIAHEQFKKAANKYKKLPLGLYLDLPVGVAQNSVEVWANPKVFLKDVSIGAPPDSFNPKGQSWGISPMNPQELREQAFEPFRKLISEHMQMAGAIRIDHVFMLMRLFWYARNKTGIYMSYPFDELLGIVALESHRHQCVVIGEDLGTPPPGFHEKMKEYQTLSFRIFRYMRWGKDYIPPQAYSENCLVTVGTHDMPTLSGFWKGKDLDLALKYGFVKKSAMKRLQAERASERLEMMKALEYHHIAFTKEDFEKEEYLNGTVYPSVLPSAICQYLTRANSCIFMISLEDIFEQDNQINLPGTNMQYPNWRFKLPVLFKEMETSPVIMQCAESIYYAPFRK